MSLKLGLVFFFFKLLLCTFYCVFFFNLFYLFQLNILNCKIYVVLNHIYVTLKVKNFIINLNICTVDKSVCV